MKVELLTEKDPKTFSTRITVKIFQGDFFKPPIYFSMMFSDEMLYKAYKPEQAIYQTFLKSIYNADFFTEAEKMLIDKQLASILNQSDNYSIGSLAYLKDNKFYSDYSIDEKYSKPTYHYNGSESVYNDFYKVAKKYSDFSKKQNESSFSSLSKKLPGIEAKVLYPCTCNPLGTKVPVWSLVQHLNDSHSEWTRERIADWLDELHDSGEINIEFQVELDGGENEQDSREKD